MYGKSFSRSEYCEETFGRKLNLDKRLNIYCHMKFNTGFNCTKCTKSFKTKQGLSSHEYMNILSQ